MESGSSSQELQPDKHPEKRERAAYMRFEEDRLPELKREWPTLKL